VTKFSAVTFDVAVRQSRLVGFHTPETYEPMYDYELALWNSATKINRDLVAVELPLNLIILPDPDDYDRSFRIAAARLIRTRIRLLAQLSSMPSIIDATRREQQHGLA
jgi:hypothetical protein